MTHPSQQRDASPKEPCWAGPQLAAALCSSRQHGLLQQAQPPAPPEPLRGERGSQLLLGSAPALKPLQCQNASSELIYLRCLRWRESSNSCGAVFLRQDASLSPLPLQQEHPKEQGLTVLASEHTLQGRSISFLGWWHPPVRPQPSTGSRLPELPAGLVWCQPRVPRLSPALGLPSPYPKHGEGRVSFHPKLPPG